jgi:hypothetical protein
MNDSKVWNTGHGKWENSMNVSEFLILVVPAVAVCIASVSVSVMTVREHPLAGGLALAAAFAESTIALSCMGVSPHYVPNWLDAGLTFLSVRAFPFVFRESSSCFLKKCQAAEICAHLVFWLFHCSCRSYPAEL